jgi:hypothetical protein
MRIANVVPVLALMSGLLESVTSAPAAATACDRACLKEFAEQLLESIAARDPARVPLAHEYAATENSIPSALSLTVIWRTATAAKDRYYVIDPTSGQVFLIATLGEGPNDTLLFGRIKVEGTLIYEIELFTNRSRGQGGFQFEAGGPSHFPTAWTIVVPPERRASRAELLQAGRSIFDPSVPAPEAASGCVVMENGKVVAENPDVLKAIGGPPKNDKSGVPRANPDGTVPVPCGNPPNRPTDKHARTTIVDEERGVVVSMAVVHGIAEPYLVTEPTESAFVPNALLQPYTEMLKKQQSSGQFKAAAVRPMAASAAVSEVHRIYDGKLQGLHLLVNLGAPGSRSPWVIDK